jgi:hypothetical protein
MSKRLSEDVKIDIGLIPSNLNGAGTGPYYPIASHRKALFQVVIGAMVAAATSVIQIIQARDAAGTGAAPVVNNTATITANQRVARATLTLNNVQIADVVDVNGLRFTAAAVADLPNRVFSQAGNDDADAVSLAAAINHATAGVPGVTAVANAAVVTLAATEPGENHVTIANAAATITPATLSAVAYVECDASFLNTANGFSHVAVQVTNSAAMQTGAVLVRGNSRYSPVQFVAAAKADVLP